ncbi:MAG: DUF2961 domain-containing protein [Rikenellaceae bacterium]|nr:DUF2961 domain-containing protein [Rikenellaceae bacterium]
MKRIKTLLMTAAASVLAVGGALAQGTVSVETLLKEMIDRDALARFPSPAYTCKQFSSYDRVSTEKGPSSWFGNADANQFIRVETTDGRTEFVMMDTEEQGPGAIVRFWMTFAGNNRGNGTLRIYLDGSDTPAIEGTAFGVLSGNEFVGAPLATSVSKLTPYGERGHDLYFPIPYGKSCKITYECKQVHKDNNGKLWPGDEVVYYNINYRTYSPQTRVITFAPGQLAQYKTLIDKVQDQMRNNYHNAVDMKLSSIDLGAELAPGASKSFEIKGSRAIRQLGLKLSADDRMQALRSTVLEIAFDGEQTVWVPIGDFMGIGYHQMDTNNWYVTAPDDGQMDAFWVMPFKSHCKITLHNLGEQPVGVAGQARYGSWRWDARSMHFGSDWHQYTKIDTKVKKGEPGNEGDSKDINYTTLKGKGVYVGDALAIFNTTNAWWGEGDEKVYVDGETFPSHFGTGSEDYYGYAWCSPSVFTDHPFIAQPVGRGSFEPTLSVNSRYRALDGIPFTKEIVFDMELWHWVQCKVNYAPTTFWYMMPGGKTLIEKDIKGVQEKVAIRKSDVTSEGLLTLEFESENLPVESKTGGIVDYQNGAEWSNGCQIYWREVEPGAKLTTQFRTGKGGIYDMTVLFTTARDYGVYNIYLNGVKIGSKIDLNNPQIKVKPIGFGNVELKSGVNTFTVEQVSAPKDFPKSVFGFDKLVFQE